MPTPKANSGNITNNHSQKNSSDSSSPIDDRTVKDTAFEVEENHRLVWEEDCSSSNVGSLSGDELSIHSTSDFASVHSDIFESSWHQHLEVWKRCKTHFHYLPLVIRVKLALRALLEKKKRLPVIPIDLQS